jgi:hypothetical protein
VSNGRDALDATLARLLAEALVAELSAELAKQTNAPDLVTQAGAQQDHLEDIQSTPRSRQHTS